MSHCGCSQLEGWAQSAAEKATTTMSAPANTGHAHLRGDERSRDRLKFVSQRHT